MLLFINDYLSQFEAAVPLKLSLVYYVAIIKYRFQIKFNGKKIKMKKENQIECD